MKESKEEKLLRITFDQTLSFKQHVKTLCKKAIQKLHALISCYMDTEKLKQVMQAFVSSHFSYCRPLVWMFYDRTLNHRINHIHERALRFAHKNHQTDFESLLEQRNLVSFQVKNLKLQMTENYKTKSGLSPPFVKDIFAKRNTGYNLTHGNDSRIPKVHTTTHGIETISFLGNRLWSTLPRVCLIGTNFENGRLGRLGICVCLTPQFRKRQVWLVWQAC